MREFTCFNVDLSHEDRIIYQRKPWHIWLEIISYGFIILFIFLAKDSLKEMQLLVMFLVLFVVGILLFRTIPLLKKIYTKDIIVFNLSTGIIEHNNKFICSIKGVRSIEVNQVSTSSGRSAPNYKLFLNTIDGSICLITAYIYGEDLVSFAQILSEKMSVKLTGNCFEKSNGIEFW